MGVRIVEKEGDEARGSLMEQREEGTGVTRAGDCRVPLLGGSFKGATGAHGVNFNSDLKVSLELLWSVVLSDAS